MSSTEIALDILISLSVIEESLLYYLESNRLGSSQEVLDSFEDYLASLDNLPIINPSEMFDRIKDVENSISRLSPPPVLGDLI